MNMEIYLKKPIIRIETHLRLPKERSDNILAFVELWQMDEDSQVIFKQRGFTLRKKEFRGVEKITVVPPAFHSKKSKSGFQVSFIIEHIELFRDITQKIIDEYNSAIGGGSLPPNEEVDLDDIPI